MAAYESNGFEDLAYEAAEGPANGFGEGEGFDQLESDFEFEGLEAEEPFEAAEMYEGEMESTEFDSADALSEGEDYAEFGEAGEAESEAIEDAMAYALGAESENEFIGRAFRALTRVLPKAAGLARAAAPVLGGIPGPVGQLGSMAARLLGNLRFEGGGEAEALEAFTEAAVTDRRAIPIVAGLTARTLVKNRGAQMPVAARKAMVKQMSAAANTLVRAAGPKAVRALPKIANSVRRTATARGTPAAARARIVRRTVAKVASRPALLQRLARPSVVGLNLVRNGRRRTYTYTIPGPAQITIRRI